MEFSFDRQPSAPDKSSQSLASDRLRKAIERNRAKQAKRSSSRTASTVNTTSWSAPGETKKPAMSAGASTTRRSVASAGNVEFTSALRKGVTKSPTKVSYSNTSASSSVTKKTATVRKPMPVRSVVKRKRKSGVQVKPNEYLVRGIWIFCGFLLLRLIFSDGGIIDFYDKKDLLEQKEMALTRVRNENKNLAKEIEKIRSNSSYQKKIVREHLGHIARDEYLILFSE